MRTESMLTNAFACLLCFGLCVDAGAARAEGSMDPAITLDQLKAEIERARHDDPEIFTRVLATARLLPELDAGRRGPFANATPLFHSLGSRAFLPMCDLLLNGLPEVEAWTGTARIALRVGMLEAIGKLYDRRSIPLMFELLAPAEISIQEAEAAAAVLAKLDDDAVLHRLADLIEKETDKSGRRRTALIKGFGRAHTGFAADFLMARLGEGLSPESTRAAIAALGRVGNQRSWQRPSMRPRAAEGDGIRERISAFLLGYYVTNETHEKETSKAILLVNHSSLPDLLARAADGQLDPKQRARLDALSQKIANNPLVHGIRAP